MRGMADAAWRLLRSFGVRSRWEMRAVQYRLLLAIARRQAGQKPEPEEAVRMAQRLLVDLADFAGLFEERRRLRERLEQLFRAFLSHRMGAPSSFHYFTAEDASLPDFEHLPDFALGNPFLEPGKARKAAAREAAGAKELKPAREWRAKVTGFGDPARQMSDEEKFLRHQLLRAMGYDDTLDQEGLERLLARAFGITDCRLPIVDCKTDTTEPSPPSSTPAPAKPTGEPGADAFQSTIGNRQSTIPSVAATLWERLVLFRNWRDSEAQELDATLERASGPQGVETWDPKQPPGPPPSPWWEPGPEDRAPHWQWRALVALLLAVFAGDIIPLTKAGAFIERLKRVLYNFLVWHYQQRRGFTPVKPDPKYEPPVLFRAAAVGARIREKYAGGPHVIRAVIRL
ncbi:MAG TPA: hypothetical protein VKM93_27725 [Terriglobia bacterium]|nr:hypothetical protein [Terriglobia bacterium]